MKLREEQKLYKEAQKLARQFVGQAGVTDIEFGLKHKKGKLTDEVSLRFRVKEKKKEKKLKQSEILPKKVGIFATDVLINQTKIHQARNENPRSIVQPLIGGIQIQSGLYGNSPSYWGTMGCFYRLKSYVFGFTNYHVLYGQTDASVVMSNYVGRLPISQNLNRTNNKIGIASNLFNPNLDYATFIIQVPFDQLQSVNMITGQLESYVYPQINMPLLKSGAKTGITYGIIDGRSCIDCSELSIYIDTRYPNNTGIISDFGDSGSVWILNDNTNIPKPVALHYAGGETPQWAKAKTFVSIFASIRNKINNQNLIT
jgi:hypothetical protein